MLFSSATKFPTATFKSTAIEVTGDGRGKLTGDFTLHGVTRPVTLDVTFNGAGTPPMTQLYIVGFDAVGSLKRSDFGIKNFVPFLGDEVKLTGSAASSIVNWKPARQRGLAIAYSAALALLLLPTTASANDWKVVAAKSWLGFRGAAQGASDRRAVHQLGCAHYVRSCPGRAGPRRRDRRHGERSHGQW